MLIFKAHQKRVRHLAFSPDGGTLATTSDDWKIRLWREEGGSMGEVQSLPGHSTGGPVVFSRCGKYFAAQVSGLLVWEWQVPLGRPLFQHKGLAASIAFSPASDVVVITGYGHFGMERFAVPSGERLPGGWGGALKANKGPRSPVGVLAYHPAGTLIASAFQIEDTQPRVFVIDLFDAATGELRGALSPSGCPEAMRFSPDGKFLAVACGPVLRVWDVATQAEAAACQVGRKYFGALAFTPGSAHLVTLNNDETVRLWETATWTQARAFDWKIGRLRGVDVSPDGCRMAAGSEKGKVIVWDVD